MVASVRDVAKLAGVSPSTVSNFLHRPHLLSADSHTSVAAAIAQLGYVPNESARQLRSGASRTLALILLDAWLPFYATMARGVEDQIGDGDWSLFFANSDRNEARELSNIDMFDAHRVQGLIINPKGDVRHRLERLQRRGIQCVAMSPLISSQAIPSISFDDLRGGRLAGEHLLEIGRERIAFIGDVQSITHSAKRLAGLMDAVRAAGRSEEAILHIPVTDLDMANGIQAAGEVLRMPAETRPDALFAANDMLALGAMTALLRAGVRIPDDIAIVGYDDVEFSRQSIVPLTTVSQPAYDMGRRAAQMLLDRLEDPKTPVEHVSFDVRLLARASTLGIDTRTSAP